MLGNPKFINNVEQHLSKMERLAKKLKAPVITVEKVTKEPFEILIFTMLSSRTKDETTLAALNRLKEKGYLKPNKLAKANPKEIEELLYGVGFYKSKAPRIIKIAKIIRDKGFPKKLEEMTKLPGVGIKTASIVLARVYRMPYLGVDTHVHRISNRLGLVNTRSPEETSKILNKELPDEIKLKFNRILVAYGQTVCKPINPSCEICVIKKICPSKKS